MTRACLKGNTEEGKLFTACVQRTAHIIESRTGCGTYCARGARINMQQTDMYRTAGWVVVVFGGLV